MGIIGKSMDLVKSTIDYVSREWKGVSITAAVFLIVPVVVVETEEYLSSTPFCLSCHSMTYLDDELQESSHISALGIDPECQSCHLPPGFIARSVSHVVDGTRALIGELKHDLSTKEKFDEHRAEYAHNARMSLRKWDGSPCRVCHTNVRPSSDEAEIEHKKMETEGLTCIDCHQNLVHDEVPEEDLVQGMKEGRIVLKPDEDDEDEDDDDEDEEEYEEETDEEEDEDDGEEE